MIRSKIEQRIEDVRQLQVEELGFLRLTEIKDKREPVPTRVIHTMSKWGVKQMSVVIHWMGIADGLRTYAMGELLHGRLKPNEAISLLGLDGKSKEAQIREKLGAERVEQILEAPPMGAAVEQDENSLAARVRAALVDKVGDMDIPHLTGSAGTAQVSVYFSADQVEQINAGIIFEWKPDREPVKTPGPVAVEQGSLLE